LPAPRLRLHRRSGAARQRARAGHPARAPAVPGPEPLSEARAPARARRARDRQSRIARLAGAAGPGGTRRREGRVDGPGPGSGGVRPGGGQRQLRAARRAAGGRAARVGAMIRRLLPWLMLAVSGGMVACAEWAGSELRGPQLSIVPLIAIGSGTLLLDDLDQLHVVVVPISSAGVPGAVADTTVPVAAAGNATLSVPIVVIGRSQPFEVTLQGIRSSDGVVLYAGVDTVIVSSTGATPPVTVPVRYIGPCQIGSGCVVTVAPQDTALATGGSLVLRISVDSAPLPVTGVPVALTNLTPVLILVAPGPAVTALLIRTGGAGRVEAAIRGAADTLRLHVAPLTAPAAVLVNPGYVTLTTLSPGNTAQLTAVVTDIAGKPLSSSLATWSSRTPGVATVASTGLVTGLAARRAVEAAREAARVGA